MVPANATEIEFGINIREDDIVEIEETFSVSLGILTAGSLRPPSNTIVVIEDNDCKDVFKLRVYYVSIIWCACIFGVRVCTCLCMYVCMYVCM